MKIKILASSSKANCYILEGERDILILEAGVFFHELKKALDFDFSKVVACMITHEHKDHCKCVKDLVKFGIDCYMSCGTNWGLGLSSDSHRIHIIREQSQFTVGEFIVKPFATIHDSDEPLGFIIQSRLSGKKIVFATDTACIMYRFSGVNCYMVECNYDINLLRENTLNGTVDEVNMKRIIKTHFEFSNVKTFLGVSDKSKLDKVVLLHLSDNNADPGRFVLEIEHIVGEGKVCVAESGLNINI